MAKSRMNILLSILNGLLFAILFTLPFMLIFAILAAYLQISDNLLIALNQLLKIVAIILGTRVTVGRGGERGFLSGALIAMLYMIIGYVLYVSLGGNAFNVPSMLGEILIGAAVGSISGAFFANLSPEKNRKKLRRT